MASDIRQWLEEHRVDVSTLAVDEIVGIGHVQAELRSIAGRLRHAEVVAEAGGELPRGLLFYGPPGTGKSTSARWLARAIGDDIPFYEFGADELSAARIRAVFRALAGVRCCVFIDEVDLIGRHRDWMGAGPGQASLRALLAALDGLLAAPGPLVVAATTRYKSELDEALLRAGRLGFHVEFDAPNEAERAELLAVLSRRRTIGSGVAWAAIAAGTKGSTPADLRQLLDDALGIALADDRIEIRQADLEAALKRDGQVGPEDDPSRIWDRRRSAIHEAGHVAVIAALFGPAEVRRVEITPYGGATELRKGARSSADLPDDLLRQRIAVAYGGLVAERFLLDRATLGSRTDIDHATQMIERLLSSGLSPRLAPLAYDALTGSRGEPTRAGYDAALAHEADEAYGLAEAIVAENLEPIRRFADALATVPELEGNALAKAIGSAGFRDGAGSPVALVAAYAAEPAA